MNTHGNLKEYFSLLKEIHIFDRIFIKEDHFLILQQYYASVFVNIPFVVGLQVLSHIIGLDMKTIFHSYFKLKG